MNSLLVGIGISDRAAPGDDPVADAVTAEALGYDFVSAFDHPVADAAIAEAVGYAVMSAASHPLRTYPTYETLTLLTWIAARTTRIGIVSRVLGVPFRRPALVAKAAESLQRLSRGRLILGLGAGYRDTEIRAAGGPGLTPRAKADGLEEAITIVRAAWTQRVVSYHGAVYSVDDLDLEPKPAEPIPIWLGAVGPRGLALTGRLADGWIPFLRFAGPDRIPDLLDRIRTASVAAGRPADAVRAVYSVPVRLDPKARSTADVIAGSAADVIEQLHSFTELGFAGFDLMPSRDQIRALAEDVVPALRTYSQQPQLSRSPDSAPAAVHQGPGRAPRPSSHQPARHRNAPAPPPDSKPPGHGPARPDDIAPIPARRPRAAAWVSGPDRALRREDLPHDHHHDRPPAAAGAPGEKDVIRTPDQRLRIFVSSTLQELAAERQAVRNAVTRLRLVPVMFELGARPHPPRQVYRAYLGQSQVFVGVYWQSYGLAAPGEDISGLEDEYLLSAGLPRLIYVKSPAPQRDPRLAKLLARIRDDGSVSYQHFSTRAELRRLVENDLAVLLSERFEMTRPRDGTRAAEVAEEAPLAGAVPVPVTPIVGRDHETAAIEDLVLEEGVRLVTLTGPGGVGKSRLAVEAAARLSPDFADGVRFADLSSVRATELVIDAVAAALGVSATGARLITDVESYLRPRRLLLVLDNFEQVVAAAPLVARLLGTAPGLVVLVTSRKKLKVRSEHELPVLTLPVPGAGADPDPQAIGQYASVRLFAERAHAADPEFDMTGGNAQTVAEICRRLEGLPLALELAAARVRMLPPKALLARLDQRLGLLTDGPRDLPERQRALKNTLDWSFDLLSADEQALFMRLGVFAGTFGLPAAEAICASDAATSSGGAEQVIDTLGSLVDSSLIQTKAGGGEPRFRLLDTIREYALHRLRQSGDWLEVHDRHAAYFAALADPDAADLQGRGQLEWLQRLETEHENLGAAMSWLVDHDQLHQAVDLTWVTWRFWWLQGHAEELARLADQILAKSQALPPRERALALSGAGFGRLSIGEQASGRALLEQSVPLFRQVEDKLREVLISAVLGHLLATEHEYARASEYLEHSRAVLRELGDEKFAGSERVQHLADIAVTYNFLGQLRLGQGDPDSAARLFAEGWDAAQGLPDRFTILISLYDLALSSQAQGDLNGAAKYLTQGLSVAAEANDRASAAYYIEALATIARLQGNAARAVRLLAAARSLLARGSGWLHLWVPRAPHGDDVLAAWRSCLGDAAFDEAWASGRSIEGRHAIELALQEG